MINLNRFIYGPIMKWKLGEVQALGSIDSSMAEIILPMLVVPATSEYDYDTLQTVTLTEHLKSFGHRLKTFCSERPILVDAGYLDEASLVAEFGCHPLLALLERARIAHATAYPVLSFSSSDEMIRVARQFLARHEHIGFAFRMSLAELDLPGWQASVSQMIERIGQRPSKAALFIDAGPLFGWDEEFISILVDKINEIPMLIEWGQVFFSSTSFPETRDTAVGLVGRFRREDKFLSLALRQRRNEVLRLPCFSDYALEYPSRFRKGGGAPKAHLRYSSEEDYIVSEGETTKGNGFKTIYPVARELCKAAEFKGRAFSIGNEFIDALSKNIGPGNPMLWRWGSTDHHLTRVAQEVAQLVGLEFTRPAIEALPEQHLLALTP